MLMMLPGKVDAKLFIQHRASSIQHREPVIISMIFPISQKKSISVRFSHFVISSVARNLVRYSVL
jgi:hypothetical protein